MPVDEITKRIRFEKWVSAPPIEKDVRRFRDSPDVCWPGQDWDPEVQLAWESWCAALDSKEV